MALSDLRIRIGLGHHRLRELNTVSDCPPRLILQLVMLTALALGILCSIPASAAEDELTLLTLEGDRIGKLPEKLDLQGGAIDPGKTIQDYYALLPTDVRLDLETLHSALLALIPDYDVAFTAADSAEITEVKSDLDSLWASIRTIHLQYFTTEVRALLDTAYDSAFSTLRPTVAKLRQ